MDSCRVEACWTAELGGNLTIAMTLIFYPSVGAITLKPM